MDIMLKVLTILRKERWTEGRKEGSKGGREVKHTE